MFIVTHAAIGALIGEKLSENPGVTFAIAFLVHFLTDIIPHGDTNLYKGYVDGTKIKKAQVIIGIDIACTIIVSLYLLTTTATNLRFVLAMGIIGGILPDAIVALRDVLHGKFLHWFHRVHFYFHNLISGRTGDLPLVHGMVMEIAILVALLFKVF